MCRLFILNTGSNSQETGLGSQPKICPLPAECRPRSLGTGVICSSGVRGTVTPHEVCLSVCVVTCVVRTATQIYLDYLACTVWLIYSICRGGMMLDIVFLHVSLSVRHWLFCCQSFQAFSQSHRRTSDVTFSGNREAPVLFTI